MPELRVDPLTGQRAIVARDRADRPGGGLSVEPPAPIDPESDPFAEGHEDRTPPEVYAVRPNGSSPNTPGWTVRVVPNLYPALRENSEQPERHANPDLFWAAPARGAHEVIVNSPKPVVSLSELTVEDVEAATAVWRERMRAHADAAYVHLIVNERREAGASLPHTHAQLYALDFVPAAIARERERFGAYATRTMGGNLLGRPRPGGGPPARADRRNRRRDRPHGPVRGARPVPAPDRPSHATAALRGRGALGRGDAPRGAVPSASAV